MMDIYQKRVLVLVEDYPNNQGNTGLMYVHTRNISYTKHGICVDVINFSAKEPYIIDGINVTPEIEIENDKYALLILHAPNIRHHYRFLKKFGHLFKRFIFFFHGHEIMYKNKDYSKPYKWKKESPMVNFLQDIYDKYKLKKWNSFIKKNNNKSYYVFVSNWMKNVFVKNVKIKESFIRNRFSIIYNGVGETFEKHTFNIKEKKEFDFITIRAVLDNSKYCVDVVNKLAKNTPNASFLLIGRGNYFKHVSKADNIVWIDEEMNHSKIIEYLDKSKFALMPTRVDAQGLMMCEMAAFGIPIITSDIDVCHEVFDGFGNVSFIDNNLCENLNSFLGKSSQCIKDNRFYKDKTSIVEIDLIESMMRSEQNGQ